MPSKESHSRNQPIHQQQSGRAIITDLIIVWEKEKEMVIKGSEADKIINRHVLWSMGAGLMPLPLFDLVAVTAIQIDMLRQLAAEYGVDYSASTGKTFVAALTGGTFARIGASIIKAIPVVGTVVGGLSMSAMSGASTYAVGQVAKGHFATGGDLSKVDLREARNAYGQEFEKAKQVVTDLENDEPAASEARKAAFEAIASLEKLIEKGLVTKEEFDVLKVKLLGRL